VNPKKSAGKYENIRSCLLMESAGFFDDIRAAVDGDKVVGYPWTVGVGAKRRKGVLSLAQRSPRDAFQRSEAVSVVFLVVSVHS
jgi:hypothetical protein